MTRHPASPLLLLLLMGCGVRGYADPTREFAPPVDESSPFPTAIHEPTAFGVLDTPIIVDAGDREVPAGTACVTCHGPVPDPAFAEHPGVDFHTAVEIDHGNLTCNQCHSEDRSILHLADGAKVPFVEVLRLCAQCHGPQYRDFLHGAHGGMNGYWDLRQGPRIRNNCVDCHTPHSPSIKQVIPALPANDRDPGRQE